uniref:TIL domain-containing protein n=1 Tax=Bombyx mori TaxID=7091 RepID=A0A8R2M4U3_BOMMO|nr:inducible metalloproteinase inhibitor protein-like isoform X2 [Bombyx mori]
MCTATTETASWQTGTHALPLKVPLRLLNNGNEQAIGGIKWRYYYVPSCTRPHEKHAFVMDCPPERSCKNRGIKFSCLADQKREQKCVCDEGYVRNESNECIEEENCDKCSEPNEEYTDCKRTCPPELCISIVAKFNCKSDEPCEAGCACKPGYYRQQNNTSCIPACQCQEMAGTPECRATIDQ